ncbi:MAG: DUF5994 family protein [Mycobacterium sp.]
MNGLDGSRRLARPVRIALTKPLGSDIDGAWWPHTGSIASELPELVGVLQQSLGAVVDILINWSVTEGPRDLNTFAAGQFVSGDPARRPRLMVVAGNDSIATLLVVPHMTSDQLGSVVMRRSVAKPIQHPPQDTKLLQIADAVMLAAQSESARWSASRRAEAAPTKTS